MNIPEITTRSNMPDNPNSWHDPSIIDQETGDDLRQIAQRAEKDAEQAAARATEAGEVTAEEVSDAGSE